MKKLNRYSVMVAQASIGVLAVISFIAIILSSFNPVIRTIFLLALLSAVYSLATLAVSSLRSKQGSDELDFTSEYPVSSLVMPVFGVLSFVSFTVLIFIADFDAESQFAEGVKYVTFQRVLDSIIVISFFYIVSVLFAEVVMKLRGKNKYLNGLSITSAVAAIVSAISAAYLAVREIFLEQRMTDDIVFRADGTEISNGLVQPEHVEIIARITWAFGLLAIFTLVSAMIYYFSLRRHNDIGEKYPLLSSQGTIMKVGFVLLGLFLIFVIIPAVLSSLLVSSSSSSSVF